MVWGIGKIVVRAIVLTWKRHDPSLLGVEIHQPACVMDVLFEGDRTVGVKVQKEGGGTEEVRADVIFVFDFVKSLSDRLSDRRPTRVRKACDQRLRTRRRPGGVLPAFGLYHSVVTSSFELAPVTLSPV